MRGGGVHEGEDSPSPVSPGMVVAEGYRVLEGKGWNDFGTILSDCLDFFGKLF